MAVPIVGLVWRCMRGEAIFPKKLSHFFGKLKIWH